VHGGGWRNTAGGWALLYKDPDHSPRTLEVLEWDGQVPSCCMPRSGIASRFDAGIHGSAWFQLRIHQAAVGGAAGAAGYPDRR
jgi:hypothetical protein